MKIIDLTHTDAPDMPVYPGTGQPVFITGCSIDGVGFLEKKITLYSHTGTHVDAPAHLLKGAKSLGQLPMDHFLGTALIVDLEQLESETIELTALEKYERPLGQVDFLLLHTGWSKYWGSEKHFSGYRVLSHEAAHLHMHLLLSPIKFQDADGSPVSAVAW